MTASAESGKSPAALEFTEEMKGYVTLGEEDFDRGYRTGRKDGTALMFHLTITVTDVARFVSDPTHLAETTGYVACAALGGKMPVEKGLFNLFVDAGKNVKNMLYRLWFRDPSGAPLTLTGFKVIHDDPGVDVWTDTTTLFTRILRGHVSKEQDAAAEQVASGIIVIHLLDFAKQLTTFRVTGPTLAARTEAAHAFGKLFMGTLWKTYGGNLVEAATR